MTQPKSQDRIELDLFLRIRSEPKPFENEAASSALQMHRERVLCRRSKRAHEAFLMARETLVRFRRSDDVLRRGSDVLPRLAVACLEVLETLDCDEDLKIVDRDVVRDALAYRLGITRRADRQQAGIAGFAVAYSGGFFGGGGRADGGEALAIGHCGGSGGFAGGGSFAGGSCFVGGGGATPCPQGGGGSSETSDDPATATGSMSASRSTDEG